MASRKAKSPDGLFKRSDEGPWYCWVRGRRHSTRTTDRKAARLVKAKLERAAADPAYLAAHETTVGGAVTAFLDDFATRGKSPHTLVMYEKKCGHLTRILGADTKLADVTSTVVSGLVKKRLEEGAARTEVGKNLTALRQVLKLAKHSGAFPFDLAAVMPIGFSLKYEPRRRALTFAEFERLVPEIARFSLKRASAVVFAVSVAPRRSELERAHGEDIDWDRWVVKIRGTKTDFSDDEVPIAPPFRELFAKWIPRRKGLLFGRWNNITRGLAAACVRAGIDRVTANDLRRTTATLLRKAGVSADIVARVLRHADSRMVERVYGRIAADAVGGVLTDQIRLSEERREKARSSNQQDSQCPGTELNRRHVDFQSGPATRRDQEVPGNAAKVDSADSSDSPLSAELPTKFSTPRDVSVAEWEWLPNESAGVLH